MFDQPFNVLEYSFTDRNALKAFWVGGKWPLPDFKLMSVLQSVLAFKLKASSNHAKQSV